MVIDGIEIEVQKKNIKNLHLYVKPPDARVLITCPKRLSNKELERFVSKHYDWLVTKRAEVLSRAENAPKRCKYQTGDSFILWGKEFKILRQGAKRFSLEISDSTAYLFYPDSMSAEKLEAHIKEFYRAELKRKIDILLPLWENKTGLHCSSYQTKDMKTRWGTCNTKTKKLWFSLRLATRDESELNYVILHELVHTAVPNHSADFKALLFKYMPNYREIEIKMKR